MKAEVTIALSSNPRTWPILSGAVEADNITLYPSTLHPSEMFWRQLRFGEFDVSEMSISSLLMATANGDGRWAGIPVFTTRKFFHTEILVRKDAGIESPADLKGKQVGVPEYQQTAALWTRGVLENEFGVKPADMSFWMERNPDHSHAHATGFEHPPGVTINQIPHEKSIGSMMVSGELDAVVHYILNANMVDRSTVDLSRHPDIKTLFADPRAEGIRYYEKSGIYPINHGMVIKRDLLERHPWIALNLYRAFEKANDLANSQRLAHTAYYVEAGLLSEEAGEALKAPLLQHGMAANRHTLETAAAYSFQQGLTPRLMALDEIFAENTMEQ